MDQQMQAGANLVDLPGLASRTPLLHFRSQAPFHSLSTQHGYAPAGMDPHFRGMVHNIPSPHKSPFQMDLADRCHVVHILPISLQARMMPSQGHSQQGNGQTSMWRPVAHPIPVRLLSTMPDLNDQPSVQSQYPHSHLGAKVDKVLSPILVAGKGLNGTPQHQMFCWRDCKCSHLHHFHSEIR